VNTIANKLALRWRDTANLVLGLWLAMSPWVFAYSNDTLPTWNALLVGVVVAVAAAAALIAFQVWQEWVNMVLGAWLILSPFLLGYSGLAEALWNQIVIGSLIGVLAIWSATIWAEQVIEGRGD
jgi:hypothetical protein